MLQEINGTQQNLNNDTSLEGTRLPAQPQVGTNELTASNSPIAETLKGTVGSPRLMQAAAASSPEMPAKPSTETDAGKPETTPAAQKPAGESQPFGSLETGPNSTSFVLSERALKQLEKGGAVFVINNVINNVIEGAKTCEKGPKMSEGDCSIECNPSRPTEYAQNNLQENTPEPSKKNVFGFWSGFAAGIFSAILFLGPKPEEKAQEPDTDSGLQPPVRVQPAERQKPNIPQQPGGTSTAKSDSAGPDTTGNKGVTQLAKVKETIVAAFDERPLEPSEMPEELELRQTMQETPAAPEAAKTGSESLSNGLSGLRLPPSRGLGILRCRVPFRPLGFSFR